MSLQWGLVAGFLYAEIGVLMLLLVPGISPQRWLKVFRSRILHSLGNQTALYFYGLFGLLLLLFLDAIREMRKYSSEDFDLNVNPKAEIQAHMKLFRAQRNFYISGFALLLSLIIRRIVTLLSSQATLMAENEAVLRQASSATAAARKFMNEGKAGEGDAQKLETKIMDLEEQVRNIKKDRDAIKSQAESVSKEYDRLMSEHEKLQKKVASSSDKKSD